MMTHPKTMMDLPPLSPAEEAEEIVEHGPTLPLKPPVPLALKILEYTVLCILIVQGAIVLALQHTDRLTPRFSFIFLLSGSISLGLFLLFTLINQQIYSRSHRQHTALRVQYQATLWVMDVPEPERIAIVAAREKALGYCQTLIEHYQQRRWLSRNLYYSLQIAIICLSGITPILILLDKLQPSDSWLEWLPVIFPAVAAIVASIVMAIPFQTTWMAAQARVARLAAEQEKFILGVTSAYAYPLNTELQPKAHQAIDTFMRQINHIHLDRIQDHEIHSGTLD
ncbi:MAG: DUF4231 domain-containing protein [Prochlorotrichaceae cyanobacterium]|jgi:hypothetical protein